MCRNIRALANFEPPATEGEIRASALHSLVSVSLVRDQETEARRARMRARARFGSGAES